jgi:hypothetical protein
VGAVAQRFGAERQGPSNYLTDPEGNVVELKGPPDRLGDGSVVQRAARRGVGVER